MSRTLEQLRALTLLHLDDRLGKTHAPGGDYSDIDLAINQAYLELNGLMEGSGHAWNIGPQITISVANGVREHELDETYGKIARIIDVHRVLVDTGGGQSFGSPTRARLNVYAHSQRFAGTDGVYLIRYATGAWWLGLRHPSPDDQTIEVIYEPVPTELTNPADIPTQIPEQYQWVLALQAAIEIKGWENRDARGLVGRLGMALAAFQKALATTTHRSASRRL